MKSSRLLLLVALLPFAAGCPAGDDFVGTDSGADAADGPGDPGAEDSGGDAAEEETGPEVPPPLTPEEVDFILSGDVDAPMDLVTNETPEGDAFLHEVSLPVDPTDPVVAHLIARMRRTLAASFGGVGIAAPQVGVHRRVFLAQRTDQTGRPVQAFLNPTIVEYSPETRAAAEGCLSVPGASPSVVRSLIVVVDYVLEDATPVVAESIGSTTDTWAAYAARIVQHEYDHLDGVLLIDR